MEALPKYTPPKKWFTQMQVHMAKERSKKRVPFRGEHIRHSGLVHKITPKAKAPKAIQQIKEKLHRGAFLTKAHIKKLFFKPKPYKPRIKEDQVVFDSAGRPPAEMVAFHRRNPLFNNDLHDRTSSEAEIPYWDIKHIPKKGGKIPANRIPLKGLKPENGPRPSAGVDQVSRWIAEGETMKERIERMKNMEDQFLAKIRKRRST